VVAHFGSAPFDLPLAEIAPMTLRLDGGSYAGPESEIPGPPQVFAISDVHGRFDTMRDLLVANKVIDGQYRWTFGRGHLVVLGDVADRGRQVTECLWFIRALEDRAKAAGGRVHMILGNHEATLAAGDHRYVDGKYTKGPDGMPGLARLYGPESELGRWLRSRPLMLKIGDTLFVHGGISPEFLAMGLDAAAANKGLRLAPPEERDGLNAFLQGPDGPLWYRGMALEGGGSISDSDLRRALARFKAKRVVVGHTTMDEVRKLHGGKVLAIDAGIQHGRAEGLFMAKGKAYRALADGSKAPIN
jgi:hypothetical protein